MFIPPVLSAFTCFPLNIWSPNAVIFRCLLSNFLLLHLHLINTVQETLVLVYVLMHTHLHQYSLIYTCFLSNRPPRMPERSQPHPLPKRPIRASQRPSALLQTPRARTSVRGACLRRFRDHVLPLVAVFQRRVRKSGGAQRCHGRQTEPFLHGAPPKHPVFSLFRPLVEILLAAHQCHSRRHLFLRTAAEKQRGGVRLARRLRAHVVGVRHCGNASHARTGAATVIVVAPRTCVLYLNLCRTCVCGGVAGACSSSTYSAFPCVCAW